MRPDPIVEEVRKAREAHAAKFNYNLAAICANLREKEKKMSHTIVSRQPKFLLPIKLKEERECDSKINCANTSSALVESEKNNL